MGITIHLIHIFVVAPALIYLGFNMDKEDPLNNIISTSLLISALLVAVLHTYLITKKINKSSSKPIIISLDKTTIEDKKNKSNI